MNRLNLISAWRNLKKNKLVSILNIIGLSIGLTCAIFAILYSYHELSYEKCHDNADRICMVYTHGSFGSLKKIPVTFGATASTLQNSFADIEVATRTMKMEGIAFDENNIPIRETDIVISEKSLFSVLSFTFLKGNIPTGPKAIVISDDIARKYFGADNPIDKTLDISIWGNKQTYTVCGVFKNLPSNTHFKASIIIPFDLAYDLNLHPDEHWSTEYTVYTLLSPGTDFKQLNNKILQSIEIPVDIENIKYVLVPIKRIHIFENIANNAKGNLLMLLIGGFIALVITIFNYINTSTLLFSARIKEIGIRKTNGGTKKNIFIQFIADSGISVSISFVLAIIIIYYLIPYFNQLVDTNIVTGINGFTILILAGIYIITIIVSSLYPAIKSLSVNTASMIQGSSHIMFSKNRLSNVLITIQFVFAILFLQFLIISQKQTKYQFSQNVIKFNPENVICIEGDPWGDLKTVKEELLMNPSIQMVSWGQSLPGANFSMTTEWKENNNKEMANSIRAEKDYLNVFQIGLKEGRFFSDKFSSDANHSVVINSLTANSLAYQEPLGQTVLIGGNKYTIIGVTDDYMAVPPIVDRMPLLIRPEGDRGHYLIIRVDPKQKSQAHAHITKVLHEANPNYPINIKYYNDMQYEAGKSYIATGIFINIFTGVIIFNAMMGLFGLSFFVSERRTKEIGIRKICGARMNNVFWDLTTGFLKKLALAMVITFPIGYMAGQQYVTLFTDKIEISPGIFILTGLIACSMVMISIGWKVIHSAIQNPVEALRYE